MDIPLTEDRFWSAIGNDNGIWILPKWGKSPLLFPKRFREIFIDTHQLIGIVIFSIGGIHTLGQKCETVPKIINGGMDIISSELSNIGSKSYRWIFRYANFPRDRPRINNIINRGIFLVCSAIKRDTFQFRHKIDIKELFTWLRLNGLWPVMIIFTICGNSPIGRWARTSHAINFACATIRANCPVGARIESQIDIHWGAYDRPKQCPIGGIFAYFLSPTNSGPIEIDIPKSIVIRIHDMLIHHPRKIKVIGLNGHKWIDLKTILDAARPFRWRNRIVKLKS